MEDIDDRIANIREMLREQLCSDAELAIATGVSTRTVHRWVRLGMPVVRVGRSRMFNPRIATLWLAEKT